MDQTVEYLDTYHGRYQAIRFCEHLARFLSGCCAKQISGKLLTFSDQLGSCRVVLRLFDDLSMLRYNLLYGFGKEDIPDIKIRILTVFSNICDQLYYPLEHLAWAEDIGLLTPRKNIDYWTASSILWALSSYFSMSRSLSQAKSLHAQKSTFKLYGSEITRKSPRYKEYVKLSNLQFLAIISALQNLADLIRAIHYFPNGFLWAGRLKEWQIGAFGVLSCLLSFYEHHASMIK